MPEEKWVWVAVAGFYVWIILLMLHGIFFAAGP
jgi:hypothetical protein